MTKPLLMLSLPNSGSSWLADVLAKHLPDCRYAMEFFNPLRNPKHERVLSRQFGSELVSCYRNIASAGDDLIDEDIAATWGREDFTFTKEVFSPFKLAVFVRHFRCFVLLRSAEQSFPPTRARIWSFYEHAWYALRENGTPLYGGSVRERAVEAHAVMLQRIKADAEWLGVPAIEYSELFGEAGTVKACLNRAVVDVSDVLVAGIIATRRVALRQETAGVSLAPLAPTGGMPHLRIHPAAQVEARA